MRKLLSIILTVVMLIPMMFTVNAANIAEGTCGEGMTWTLDDMGTLSIFGNGIIDNYGLFNPAPWYDLRANVKQVIIYDALVIGTNAFRDCYNMTKATVVGGNLAIIGNEAFANCTSLDTIYLGESAQYIGSGVIAGTAYYKNTANWTDGILYVGSYLIEVAHGTAGELNVKAGTRVIADYAGDLYDSQLTAVNIPDSVITVGDYAFSGCSNVTEINIGLGVTTIGEYAFDEAAITSLTIPDNVTTVESWAFSDCPNLTDINIGTGVTSLGGTAFNGSAYYEDDSNWEGSLLYIGDYLADERSSWGGNEFVIKDGTRVLSDDSFSNNSVITSVQIPDTVTVFGNRSFDNVPNLTIKCYEGSLAKAYAEMRSIPYEIVCKHSYGEWTVETEPSYTAPGKRIRICVNCNGVDEEEIPMLEGAPEPYLTAEGVQLTIHNLYGVKDVWVAEGDYDTYRDVKNHVLFNVTAAKIGTATDYTYMVKNHGRHTVYIRYTDGSAVALKIDITGVEPTFRTNGLRLTIGNLENVKVIRTAYGDYDRVGLMKKAATHRGFTAKSSIKGADSYMIQYRNEGTVTVAVVYNDGYEAFYTYEVAKKTPTLEQNGDTVVFGNLDGLYNIRYAKGQYTTSSQIKAAPGSVALKPAKIDENGNITVKLTEGTYTFCVQYDDESFNYYKIVVE